MTLLTSLLLRLLSAITTSYQCLHPSSTAPNPRDCHAVIAGIYHVAQRPYENERKSWGRHVGQGRFSESLPKMIWIEGRQPPETCAVEVGC